MIITEFLERNARFNPDGEALVEINPTEERDNAETWREASLIELALPDMPYRRSMTWRRFDRMANRIGNFLLSRNVKRGTKVGILMMNCIEWLPVYFGILKAGCVVVPLNYRYASDEIQYCCGPVDYRLNVGNAKAESFYRRHGVDDIEYGLEVTQNYDGKALMTTKYCLRYELGQCLKMKNHPNADKNYQKDLFLENNGRRFALKFDCDACEMLIYKS